MHERRALAELRTLQPRVPTPISRGRFCAFRQFLRVPTGRVCRCTGASSLGLFSVPTFTRGATSSGAIVFRGR